MFEYRSAIGQDSHRFAKAQEIKNDPDRVLVLAGLPFPDEAPFLANSDGDVFLHAVTNAISGITGKNILGARADELCLFKGVTDSRVYLREALSDLGEWEIIHVSFSAEGKIPKLASHIPKMKESIGKLLFLSPDSVGITATTGEGLSDFGKGLGMMVFCCITVRRQIA